MIAIATPCWKGKRERCAISGSIARARRNLLRTANFGQIHVGNYDPIMKLPDLHRHDISWKRTAFRGINTRDRRPGTLSANKGRECLARRLRFLAENT